MHTFNIKVNNSQSHNKPVYNLYKDNLDIILDSNIENFVVKTIYTKLEPLK